MRSALYHYKAQLVEVYDGDTIKIILSLGLNHYLGSEAKPIKIRLFGIDTPEIRTRDLEEKARGYGARDRLKDLLGPPGSTIWIRTEKDKSGKFGRLLGTVWGEEGLMNHPDGNEVSANQILIDEGHAKVYEP